MSKAKENRNVAISRLGTYPFKQDRQSVELDTILMKRNLERYPVVYELVVTHKFRDRDLDPKVDRMLFRTLEDAIGQLTINDYVKPEDLRQLSERHYTGYVMPNESSVFRFVSVSIHTMIVF